MGQLATTIQKALTNAFRTLICSMWHNNAGCGFDSRLGPTKNCNMVLITSLLGTKSSGLDLVG